MADGGGGKKKMMIIVGVVVLLLLVAVGAYFMFFAGGAKPPPDAAQKVVAPVTAVVEPLAVPLFLPLNAFVVNLKDGRRYLKTKIQLMLSDPDALAYLQTRLVEVQDIVLTELQSMSAAEVSQADAREVLKQRIISAISQLFPSQPAWEDPEPIRKVLFEEFVVQ